MKILVTAFGPFPGVPDNPTARLLAQLQTDADLDGRSEITPIFRLLDTEWAGATHAHTDAIKAHAPELAVHFGYSIKARGFVLERQACNEISGRPDAAGLSMGSGPIEPAGCEVHETGLDLKTIKDSLAAASLPATLSNNAGRYICNMVYYRSLALAAAPGPLKHALFVHMPEILSDKFDISGDNDLSMEDALLGAKIILNGCAAQMAEVHTV